MQVRSTAEALPPSFTRSTVCPRGVDVRGGHWRRDVDSRDRGPAPPAPRPRRSPVCTAGASASAIDETYPWLAPQLGTECDFVIYRRSLVS